MLLLTTTLVAFLSLPTAPSGDDADLCGSTTFTASEINNLDVPAGAPEHVYFNNVDVCGLQDNKGLVGVFTTGPQSNTEKTNLETPLLHIPPKSRVVSVDIAVRGVDYKSRWNGWAGPFSVGFLIKKDKPQKDDVPMVVVQDPDSNKFSAGWFPWGCTTVSYTVDYKTNPRIDLLERSDAPIYHNVSLRRDGGNYVGGGVLVDEVTYTVNYILPGHPDYGDVTAAYAKRPCKKKDETYFDGSCYTFVEMDNYEAGKEACDKWGGYPVIINSKEEMSFVVGTYRYPHKMIGLTRGDNAEDPWTWDDGTTLPDYFGPVSFRLGTDEGNCAILDYLGAYMKSHPCDTPTYNGVPIQMVCEKSADE